MTPQHPGDVFHRFDVASHRTETPALEKLLCPCRVGVVPEALEVLLEQVGSDRTQVHLQQLGQLHALGVAEVLLALQEAPAALAQDRILALFFESASLFGTDLVESLAEVLHDVKAVENVYRSGQPLADHGEVGFPDIRADDGNLAEEARRLLLTGRFLLAQVLLLQLGKAVVQGLLRPLFAHPQQAAAVGVDLVQQGQIMMARAILDFIHAEGRDLVEAAMSEPIVHDVLDGVVDLVPSGAEGARHLEPRQLFGPLGQEAAVDVGQVVLARAPGHLLDDYPAAGGAGNPAHAIHQKDREPPQGNKLEQPSLGGGVIGGGQVTAAAARAPGVLPGSDPHPYPSLPVKMTALKHKPLEGRAPV